MFNLFRPGIKPPMNTMSPNDMAGIGGIGAYAAHAKGRQMPTQNGMLSDPQLNTSGTSGLATNQPGQQMNQAELMVNQYLNMRQKRM